MLAAALLAAGLAGAASSGVAQSQEATSSGLDASELRRTSDTSLATDLRRSPPPAGDPFSTRSEETPDKPFSRGSQDVAGRPAGPDDAAATREAAEADDAGKKPAKLAFDLFEDQDGQARRPGLAAAPASPGSSARKEPVATAGREAPDRSGTLRPSKTLGGKKAGDPRAPSRDGGLPAGDLGLRAGPVGTPRADRLLGRQNLAVAGLRPAVPLAADDPFAPVGIRVGKFVLTSALEQSLGASTNLSESAGGDSGLFSETTLSTRLLSDWSAHEAELNGLFSYRRNFAGDLESDPAVALDGRLRLDVDRLTTATLRGAFRYEKEDAIDLGAGESRSDRPDILTSSASGEIARTFGRIGTAFTGSVVREDHPGENGPGENGPEESGPAESELGDAEVAAGLGESFTTYTAALRTGYELSPALKPFVQGSVGRRLFDEDTDAAGLERDATIEALRGGLEFDFGEKLRGEAAAGYAWNVPDAGALGTVGSPTLDGRLAWSPQRGTDVVLTGTTSFDPDDDGSGTSTLYESALAVRHRVTARTDLTAALWASYRDSETAEDVETGYAAETGFTYWLNRSLALTGLLRHEALDGERPDSDYTADSVRLGIRLQR